MIPNRKTLERLLWKHTHRDFKGTTDGIRHVLDLQEGATLSVPVASLTDTRILEKLPARIREALTSDRFNDDERKQALAGLCTWQTATGMPWIRYCTKKATDGFLCAEHGAIQFDAELLARKARKGI